MLTRATYELAELEEAIQVRYPSEQEAIHKVGSLAGTCASTLWNIVDWLNNATDLATKTALANAGFATPESLRDYVQNSSPDLTLCWEITNGVKHFQLRGPTLSASQIEQAMLSAPPFTSSTPPTYQFVPKVKTAQGANLPAVKIYRSGLQFWQQFLAQLGL